jgi:hypothetical protein
MAATEIAQVAQVDLKGLQGVKGRVFWVYFIKAFFEGCYHVSAPYERKLPTSSGAGLNT